MLKTLLMYFCALILPTAAFADEIIPVPNPTPPIVAPQIERTLMIIKPDAVFDNHIGDIIARSEKAGLSVIGLKMVQLTQGRAQQFYSIHMGKPFYPDLINFMSRGPVVVIALEGDMAIAKNRELIGNTDPKIAAPGTIRAEFAKSKTENAVHGSDSVESAKTEINFFFKPNELQPRVRGGSPRL